MFDPTCEYREALHFRVMKRRLISHAMYVSSHPAEPGNRKADHVRFCVSTLQSSRYARP